MEQVTWDTLEVEKRSGSFVYMIHDAVGNVAYVGHTTAAARRFAAHATGETEVGQYVMRHRPASGAWRITLYSGGRELETALIKLHEPPLNKSQRADRAANLILNPPVDPQWREKLQAEFVAAAVDDYIERAVVPHHFGILVGTAMHRQRRTWHDTFYAQHSLREAFAFAFAHYVAGGDAWAVDAGRAAYDIASAAFALEVEKVRAFCETVAMPEPDVKGRLPLLNGRAVNARDVARQMGAWPEEFRADEDRGLRVPLDERKGFPAAQWMPTRGFYISP